MRRVLLVCMLTLCLLILDKGMIARAGKITKTRKIPEVFDEFKRCCIKKGCPFKIEEQTLGLNCILLGFYGGNKVSCICK